MEIGTEISFAKNHALAICWTMAEVESFPSPRPADRLDLGNFLFSGSLFTFPYLALLRSGAGIEPMTLSLLLTCLPTRLC